LEPGVNLFIPTIRGRSCHSINDFDKYCQKVHDKQEQYRGDDCLISALMIWTEQCFDRDIVYGHNMQHWKNAIKRNLDTLKEMGYHIKQPTQHLDPKLIHTQLLPIVYICYGDRVYDVKSVCESDDLCFDRSTSLPSGHRRGRGHQSSEEEGDQGPRHRVIALSKFTRKDLTILSKVIKLDELRVTLEFCKPLARSMSTLPEMVLELLGRLDIEDMYNLFVAVK